MDLLEVVFDLGKVGFSQLVFVIDLANTSIKGRECVAGLGGTSWTV